MTPDQLETLLILYARAITTPLDTIEQKELWKKIRYALVDIAVDYTGKIMKAEIKDYKDKT